MLTFLKKKRKTEISNVREIVQMNPVESLTLRIKFLQAAKQGDVDFLRRQIDDGMPLLVDDKLGYTALHWAAAYGQPEAINLLIFKGANVDCLSLDGITPLHLAAKNSQINAVNLLVESGANPQIKNQKGERPAELCKKDPTLYALLSGGSKVGTPSNDHILDAAKDLMRTTLAPIEAHQERIILGCQRALDGANNLDDIDTTNHKKIKDTLLKYKLCNEDYKAVVASVSQYHGRLGDNKKSIETIAGALDETGREITSRLMRRRTESAALQAEKSGCDDLLAQKQDELLFVTVEFMEAERKYLEVKTKKDTLESEIRNLKERKEREIIDFQSVEDDESAISKHHEEFQKTKKIVTEGMGSLRSFDRKTTDLLLKTCGEYDQFLKRYNRAINEIVNDIDRKERKMQQRVKDQAELVGEISTLELKLDPSQVEVLTSDYVLNKERFKRRKEKMNIISNQIQCDFSDLSKLLSEMGRSIDPILAEE